MTAAYDTNDADGACCANNTAGRKDGATKSDGSTQSDRATETSAAPTAGPPLQAWAEVDLERLRLNLDYVRTVVPAPVKFMAVVKADAYGHGMIRVARTAVAWGCDWLGVGNASEALALREAGVQAPCLVLAPVLPEDIGALVRAGLTLSVCELGVAEQISRAALSSGHGPAEIHLLVDVGMGRFGVHPDRLAELAEQAGQLEGVRIGGVYTHFADPLNRARTQSEFDTFLQTVRRTERARGKFELVHAAASEVALTLPEARLDMVRIGNLLYGFWPWRRHRLPKVPGKDLTPAWTLRARIIAVRELVRGQGLGYGENRVKQRMRVAVLPVGISDGVSLRSVQSSAGPRAVLSTLVRELARALVPRWRAHVLVRGTRAPLVGRIGMQFTLVDVTGVPGVEVGDVAVVPGVRATAACLLPRVYLGQEQGKGTGQSRKSQVSEEPQESR